MKRLRIFALAAVAALSAACSAPGAVAQHVEPVSAGGVTSGTLLDERALYAAEAVYNVAANAYVTLDGRGLLPPALKARVRPLLLDAFAALQAARSAYRLGDAGGFTAKIAAVRDLATRARALMPAAN